MEFGVTIPRELIDRGSSAPYGKLYDFIREVEELGYGFAAIGHHRFAPERSNNEPSSPLVMLAALLANTSRLHVLTSIYLLPTYHPLDAAEQIATLQEMSNGRFILGAGMGYRQYEFDSVGIPFRSRISRYEESLDIVRLALSGNEFSYAGKHFNIPPTTLTPPPIAGKSTPIWLGANSDAGLLRAAARADGWLAGYPYSLAEIARSAATYRAAAKAAGNSATLCLMREFHIAETRAAINPDWLKGVIEVNRHYRSAGAAISNDSLDEAPPTFDEYVPGRAIAGTPDDCIREIERTRSEASCEYMMLTPVGLQDPGLYIKELRLFARTVMPGFA
jgi:alkanesulfonate monooxygenase SsuD/methylene tetrahydromethanopterin reductase-like flavin-dependent oxidoreductase (luciferase family)